MKKLYTVLLSLLLAVQAYAAATPQVGFYVRTNCNQITVPATNQTACLQSTTASGRTAGSIYVWNGSTWAAPDNGGITQLTGDVTAGPGNGSQAATLANTAVTPGSYTSTNLTVDAKGRITAAANGGGGGGGCSTSGSSILMGDGAGGCSNVTIGSGLDFTKGVLSATGGGGAGLTLVEHKAITINSTDITFSGLDGDTDGTYLLKAKIKNNAGGVAAYFFQPNNATTNLSVLFNLINAGGTSNANSSTGYMGGTDSGKLFTSDLTFYARKVQNSVALTRTWLTNSNMFQSGQRARTDIAGEWDESSTNVTSIVIHSDQTNGIGDGSELWLYKYAQ